MGYRSGSGFAQFVESPFTCSEDEESKTDFFGRGGSFKSSFSPASTSITLPCTSSGGSRPIAPGGSPLGGDRPALQRDVLQSRESFGAAPPPLGGDAFRMCSPSFRDQAIRFETHKAELAPPSLKRRPSAAEHPMPQLGPERSLRAPSSNSRNQLGPGLRQISKLQEIAPSSPKQRNTSVGEDLSSTPEQLPSVDPFRMSDSKFRSQLFRPLSAAEFATQPGLRSSQAHTPTGISADRVGGCSQQQQQQGSLQPSAKVQSENALPSVGDPFRASSSSFRKQVQPSNGGWAFHKQPPSVAECARAADRWEQHPRIPQGSRNSQSEPCLHAAFSQHSCVTRGSMVDGFPSASASAAKLPALDQKGQTSLGKHFGAAKEKLRNIWQFGKGRAAPTDDIPASEGLQGRSAEAGPQLDLGPHHTGIAQKVFQSHAGDTDALPFARLPAALQSLQAACKEFELSDDCLGQVHQKFGSLSCTDLSFVEFATLFKQGLHGTDYFAPKRAGSATGLPVIGPDGQRPDSSLAARAAANGAKGSLKFAPSSGTNWRDHQSPRADSASNAKQQVESGMSPLSPLSARNAASVAKTKGSSSKKRVRHTIIKLLKDPDLENIARQIFHLLSQTSNGGTFDVLQLQKVLSSFSIGCLEKIIRHIAGSSEPGQGQHWDFTQFFDLLRTELRDYAIANKADGPLSIKEFLALVR